MTPFDILYSILSFWGDIMNKIKKGDIVARISYGKDILFRVKRIIRLTNGKKIVLLKGLTERIEASSYLEDLCKVEKEIVENNLRSLEFKLEKRITQSKHNNKNHKEVFNNTTRSKESDETGKILHLDGDRKYSEKSIRYYKKLGLNAIVKNIPESRQPKVVYRLLEFYKPDILVVTGHDGMIKRESGYNDIYNYRNSKHFIQTVKEAKRYDQDYDKNTVIFAGACQSYFEALIMAGANFASSPARILIDFLDPLIVAEKVAITDSYRYITIDDISGELRDGKKGVGGVGANGKRRNQKV